MALNNKKKNPMSLGLGWNVAIQLKTIEELTIYGDGAYGNLQCIKKRKVMKLTP